MKLVMVTTSPSHWEGLAGNTAMFSEAVVQPDLLEALPEDAVDTIFIKKNPGTRRFEKAWRGKAKNFKRITKQDREYLVFEIEGLKKYDCPEILRTKTVGCHILTENIEAPMDAPRRPVAASAKKSEPKISFKAPEPIVEEHEPAFFNTPVSAETEMPIHLNGNGRAKHDEIEAILSESPRKEPVETIEVMAEETAPAIAVNNLEPGFFATLLTTTNPAEFEQHCYYLLRVLGIHDLHRPVNHAGTDAHGFFRFNTLTVLYSTTLVPEVMKENPLVMDHYLNLLKKEKMRFTHTSYTLKDTQKQVWLITNKANEAKQIRTEDNIKLKIVPVSSLIALYRRRLENTEMNLDSTWEELKNI